MNNLLPLQQNASRTAVPLIDFLYQIWFYFELLSIDVPLGIPVAKLTSDQTAREKDVANTLASLRIENFSPSDSLKMGLQEYIEEKKTTEDLLTDVKAKYVALGR